MKQHKIGFLFVTFPGHSVDFDIDHFLMGLDVKVTKIPGVIKRYHLEFLSVNTDNVIEQLEKSGLEPKITR